MVRNVTVTPIDRSYDSLLTINFGSYDDEFIAIIDGKVVGHDRNEKHLVMEIKKKYPGKLPFIVKVPDRSDTPYV